MSVWLDEYYLKQLSGQLPLFKAKGNQRYNARCVICGDSQTNKSKARWYAFPHKSAIMTKCHNCGYAQSFSVFLRTVDPVLFNHYNLQKLQEKSLFVQPAVESATVPVGVNISVFKALRKVSQLNPDHPAKRWIEARRIPSKQHYRLYYTSNFKQFVNDLVPDKFAHATATDCRIVIPLVDSDKQTVIGLLGRSIDPANPLRYITIMLDDTKPKLYGLDQLDHSRKISVVEGPLDSLFLSNTIASCGSDLISSLGRISTNTQDFTIIYDNQPRNKQIIDKISQCIDRTYPVVIWPDSIYYKDINDMVLGGMQPFEIRNIIKENTFTGLQAKMRLQSWRRV